MYPRIFGDIPPAASSPLAIAVSVWGCARQWLIKPPPFLPDLRSADLPTARRVRVVTRSRAQPSGGHGRLFRSKSVRDVRRGVWRRQRCLGTSFGDSQGPSRTSSPDLVPTNRPPGASDSARVVEDQGHDCHAVTLMACRDSPSAQNVACALCCPRTGGVRVLVVDSPGRPGLTTARPPDPLTCRLGFTLFGVARYESLPWRPGVDQRRKRTA